MALRIIENTYLTDIANAIRTKCGDSEARYTPAEMAAAIEALSTGGGGSEDCNGFHIPEEKLALTGDCANLFANGKWDWIIELYGSSMSTSEITAANSMFLNSKIKEIPFDIHLKVSTYGTSVTSMFQLASIEVVPRIIGGNLSSLNYMFSGCNYLRNFPDDFLDNLTLAQYVSLYSIFNNCYSLRSIPVEIYSRVNPTENSTWSGSFKEMFDSCYCLDEVIELPLTCTATWTSNMFSSAFSSCSKLKNFTFALQEDGTPYVMNWKSQVLDFSSYVGYGVNSHYFTGYNSGLTAEDGVTGYYDYIEKRSKDYWTTDLTYSRYDHDSAVATINSLPDTSAYLATAGGTNTIKFKSDSGKNKFTGSQYTENVFGIGTLTEAEIAVATAKGWTVTLV